MKSFRVDIYKIALFARTSLDALRLLSFVFERKESLIGISMGENGFFSRIIGPILKSKFTYFDIDVDLDLYNLKNINKKTKIFALLGDPVQFSIGHIFHNKIFKDKNINAVYVKIKLNKDEIDTFFTFAEKLPFNGFSITMPLKEAVVPFVKNKSKLAVINTIVKRNEAFYGYNTDNQAVIDLIEEHMPIRDKVILIIGAGATAKAISYEAKKRKAKIFICNRTYKRAVCLAEELNCIACRQEDLENLNFDILINATSFYMFEDMSFLQNFKKVIKEHVLIFDVSMKDTFFLEEAKNKNCLFISGKQMFERQALYQQEFFLLKK